MILKSLKVFEINNYIKHLLIEDTILNNINVEGEISNFKHHYSGHMYFSLKDEKSRIKCVMFKSYNKDLQLKLQDGMKVIVSGYISVFESDGSYQLYAKNISIYGIGDLYAKFENLKKRLEAEGLFDINRKKTIPYMPKKIGVVTSLTGAAIRDILSVIRRRNPTTDIIIYPVLVQGLRAHIEICEGLQYFNNRDDIDLVITGRGGGSIEELWAFNEEDVSRTISSLKIPVISAVGHETDFTIADFVADLRAPTPSAAGELAVPNNSLIKDKLKGYLIRLQNSMYNNIKLKREKLEKNKFRSRIFNDPLLLVGENMQKLDNLLKDLIIYNDIILNRNKTRLENIVSKLDTLSPLSVLSRGYNIATDEDDKVINSIEMVNIEDKIKIILKDGEITSKVLEIKSKEV